jgi:hypothetical protein
MTVKTNRNIPRIIAVVLMFMIGLNALAAGFSFISDPSGKGLGISLAYLDHSPFRNYFVPGLILFIVNGIMNFIAAFITIRKSKGYANLILLQGILLGGWIIVQIIMVRDFILLHFICLVVSAALIRIGSWLASK